MWRENPGFAKGLAPRQEDEPKHRGCRQRVDVLRLVVRGDDAFEVPPQLIHRVQLRRLLRQPNQLDAEGRGKGLRPAVRVATRSIEQEPNGAHPAVASSE